MIPRYGVGIPVQHPQSGHPHWNPQDRGQLPSYEHATMQSTYGESRPQYAQLPTYTPPQASAPPAPNGTSSDPSAPPPAYGQAQR